MPLTSRETAFHQRFLRNDEENKNRKHVNQCHGREHAVIGNHLVIHAQAAQVRRHNRHLARQNQGIKEQVVRPRAHEVNTLIDAMPGFDHVNDDLEKRGQAVAAVHQCGVFDVLGGYR